jgi:hypothetical protein
LPTPASSLSLPPSLPPCLPYATPLPSKARRFCVATWPRRRPRSSWAQGVHGPLQRARSCRGHIEKYRRGAFYILLGQEASNATPEITSARMASTAAFLIHPPARPPRSVRPRPAPLPPAIPVPHTPLRSSVPPLSLLVGSLAPSLDRSLIARSRARSSLARSLARSLAGSLAPSEARGERATASGSGGWRKGSYRSEGRSWEEGGERAGWDASGRECEGVIPADASP